MESRSTKTIFVFLGAPGMGKGSLSQLCVDRLKWVQISTGDLCRWHIANKTELGRAIDFSIKSGNLVADQTIIDMVDEALALEFELASTIILDGFPRTAPQAKALEELLARPSFEGVGFRIVKMEVEDAEIIARLSSRWVCSNKACQRIYNTRYAHLSPRESGICDVCGSALVRRADDEPTSIAHRLKVYKEHEAPLLEYYERVGRKIVIIDASKPLEEVFQAFLATLA